MTTRDHVKLIKRIEAHLITLGAVPTPERSYEYALQTPIGELGITFCKTFHLYGVTAIFTRFNPQPGAPAPELAMQRFPHEVGKNGKWNHHFHKKSCSAESVYALFVADLEKTRDARALAIVAAAAPAQPAA